MVCSSWKLLLIAVVIFVIFEPINGTFSGNDLCSAKYDSEYEDACLRGFRMKEEAEKHAFVGLTGVTCENSCSDIYKNDAKLVNACKYGCDITLSAVVGDGMGGLFDQLWKTMMNQFKKVENLLGNEPTLTPDNTEHQDQEESEVKNSGTVIRRIRIFLPLGHPEHASIQRSAQTLDDSENPLDKIRQFLDFSPLSDPHANDQTVDRNNQQVPHHGQDFNAMVHLNSYEDNDMTSFADKFVLFVRSVNPITALLSMLLVFIAIISFIQLSICVCRRRARRTYLHTSLPADVEKFVPYYPVGLEEKKNGEGKAADPKDSKEALGV